MSESIKKLEQKKCILIEKLNAKDIIYTPSDCDEIDKDLLFLGCFKSYTFEDIELIDNYLSLRINILNVEPLNEIKDQLIDLSDKLRKV